MTASKPILFVELIDKENDEVEFRITDEGRQVIEGINQKLVGFDHLDLGCDNCRTSENRKVFFSE